MSPTCPTCGAPVPPASPAPPFCSPRCRLVDLGRWLGEEYRIPAVEDAGDPGAGPTRTAPAAPPAPTAPPAPPRG